MSFRWDAKRFETLESFRDYVFSLTRPAWIKRIVMHHTWKPIQSEWRGLQSMSALERFYRDQVIWYDSLGNKHVGWPAGPHLFLAKNTPNPQLWDGIFQGTPINQVGVHAGECNDGLGVEVVGNFDKSPWGSDLRALNLGVVQTLLDWTDLPITSVIGHRDCNSPKTCPGTKVDLSEFRRDLADLQSDPWGSFGECPPPPEQRGWDINQLWLKNKDALGPSLGCPEYINDGKGTVYRVFMRGITVDRNNTGGKAWTWVELLRGT